MNSHLIRFKLGAHCPNCGSWDIERVQRPFWAKNLFFFLNLKTYWCRKCFVITTCFKKEEN